MKSMRMAQAVAVCLSVWTLSGAAAESTGTLTVTVMSSEKAPVAGATVKAVRIMDSKEKKATTDGSGVCKLTLPVGTYCLTVRGAGFRPDFMGGAIVRAKTDFPLRFALYPGNSEEKLPHEKTPAERAKELAEAQGKKGADAGMTPGRVIDATLTGLDEACRICKIKRTNGGPASRAGLVADALDAVRKRNHPLALQKYKLALGEDATDPNSWFNCGVLFNIQRMSRPAEVCFRTAIGLCGGGGDALYHAYLGRAYGAQGRMEAAEKAFKSAILIDPAKEGQFIYELACGYHSQRDFKNSSELFAKAVEKKCPDPQVYFALGNAYEMLGRKVQAIEQYKIFLEKGATDPVLADFIQRAKEKIERMKKAGTAR